MPGHRETQPGQPFCDSRSVFDGRGGLLLHTGRVSVHRWSRSRPVPSTARRRPHESTGSSRRCSRFR